MDNYIRNIAAPVSLKGTLYDFQIEGVELSLKFKRVINGDDMGTGKTIQAIATTVAANAFPCLVICPASLKLNWQQEWENWTDKKAVLLSNANHNTWHYFADEKIQVFGSATQAHVFIVNYESLRKYFVLDMPGRNGNLKLKDVQFDPRINVFKSVIIDEAHRVKDPSTIQAKLVKGIAYGKEFIQELTGTPVVNTPGDLISQLGILNRLVDFGGNNEFRARYCDKNADLKGLQHKLKNTCYFRREKKDVLKDLPDKTRHLVPCEITQNCVEEYNAAIDDLAEYLRQYRMASEWDVQRSMRGEAMVRIGVLKNISARGKLPMVIEYVNDVVASGQKIIVFVHLREISQALKDKFPEAVTILGEDSNHNRDINKKKFQEDPDTKIIICSIKAAGVGLTLTAASNVLFVELPWHHADADQAEDRAYRNGQKDNVHCAYFIGRGTIDNHIWGIIQKKREVFQEITGAKDYANTNVMMDVLDFMAQKIYEGRIDDLKIR
jgi:SWI/SNF-related matrix-associated actin-dependent regulator of chromatin subfamily A-like protein 1